MPLNPLIPLSGEQSRFGASIAAGVQQRQENEQKNRLFELTEQEATAKAIEAEAKAKTERDKARLTDIAIFSETTLLPEIAKAKQTGDVSGLTDILRRRKIELDADPTKDSRETTEALTLLGQPGGLEQLEKLGRAVVHEARLMKYIPEEPKAQSPIGKIREDERAGRITSAEANAAINKAQRIASSDSGGDTERQRKIAGLVGRGFDQNDAADLVEGRIRLTTPDEFGNIYKINLATGAKQQVVGEGQVAQDGAQGVDQPNVQAGVGQESIIESARKGTGPISAALMGVSNLFGFLNPSGQITPETSKAKQRLRLFNKEAERSLVNNQKFLAGEMEQVRTMLADQDRIFQNPADAVSNYVELINFLGVKLQANKESIASGEITAKRKGDLADQNDAIMRVISLAGKPPTERMNELDQKIQDGSATDEEVEEYINANQ